MDYMVSLLFKIGERESYKKETPVFSCTNAENGMCEGKYFHGEVMLCFKDQWWIILNIVLFYKDLWYISNDE